MAIVKREKMVDKDDVWYVDEIEINIEIKREEGERIGKEEEDRRGGERTGFAAVKEKRCGLCVKASEENMELEERAKWVEAELREAKAELRETKMGVVVLRALPKTRKPRPTDWTADENAALIEGVDEYGLD